MLSWPDDPLQVYLRLLPGRQAPVIVGLLRRLSVQARPCLDLRWRQHTGLNFNSESI